MLKEATLHYLHTTESSLSPEELAKVDEAIEDVMAHAEPRTIHRIFPLKETNGILSVDANINMNYPDLQAHLLGCEACLFIAGTLGVMMDKELLAVLDTQRRIGLAVTPRHLMVPTKSISGFVGIGAVRKVRTCEGCQMFEKCEFRRNNTRCYQVNEE